jgi:hypothetical protein
MMAWILCAESAQGLSEKHYGRGKSEIGLSDSDEPIGRTLEKIARYLGKAMIV